MKCRQVTDRILRDNGVRPELRDHVAGCPVCAQAARVVGGLQDAGEEARRRDLSTASLRETRRRAANIIDSPVEQSSVWILFPGRAWVTAAAASLLVFLGLFAALRDTGNGDKGAATGVPGIGTPRTVDREIEAVRAALLTGVRDFRQRYGAAPKRTRFDSMSSDLRARIEVCSIELGRGMPGEL